MICTASESQVEWATKGIEVSQFDRGFKSFGAQKKVASKKSNVQKNR